MMARKWWKVGLALGVTMPGLLLRMSGFELGPLTSLATFGGGIIAAAFILSWAAEAVQEDISASLATAILALIAMLPEYGVDLYFAFSAGHIPEHTKYAAANMTGSNRLLLGLGWPLMLGLLILWGRRKKVKVTQIQLKPQRRVELGFLAVASLYSLTIPWRHGIHLIDGVLLLGIFLAHTWRVSKEERTEPELDGVAQDLGSLPQTLRRVVLAGLFIWSALIIVSVAEPFAKSLITGGKTLGLDEFLLVQWVAPLATEAPEFLVAAILALKGDQDTALGTLLSSKVNQWTLLVGSLPIAYIAGGGHHSLPLDGRQIEEFWLTAAQTILGFAILSKLTMKRWEALTLFGLFALQFPFPQPELRMGFAWLYGALALVLLIRHKNELPNILKAFLPGRKLPAGD